MMVIQEIRKRAGFIAGPVLGIDCGTTNTVIAIHDGDAPARVIRFPTPGGGAASAFRSVLSFRDRAAGEAAGAIVICIGNGW